MKTVKIINKGIRCFGFGVVVGAHNVVIHVPFASINIKKVAFRCGKQTAHDF